MITIYNKTSSGHLQLFPYTRTNQFKSHAAAYRYLGNLRRSYNAGCVVVTQMSYDKAQRIYMANH